MAPYFFACFIGFADGAEPALVGATVLRSARRAAFRDGRTMTCPPSAPGTAPRTRRRLRSAFTCTILRFSVVRRTTPMWPDILRPLNTRPGVWRWPIVPGERCDTDTPWVAGRPP